MWRGDGGGVVVVVVVVLTLTRFNQVRGHRTGSSHSGAEEYQEKHTQPKVVYIYICMYVCVKASLVGDWYHNHDGFFNSDG